jgi:hypothetical protein
MLAAINKTLIAPVIDKEFATFSLSHYNKSIPDDAVFTVAHTDISLPRPQGYDEIINAFDKVAQAAWSNMDNVMILALRQTTANNHFSLVQGWKTRKAKDQFDFSDAYFEFKKALFPTGPSIGGCPWDE